MILSEITLDTLWEFVNNRLKLKSHSTGYDLLYLIEWYKTFKPRDKVTVYTLEEKSIVVFIGTDCRVAYYTKAGVFCKKRLDHYSVTQATMRKNDTIIVVTFNREIVVYTGVDLNNKEIPPL